MSDLRDLLRESASPETARDLDPSTVWRAGRARRRRRRLRTAALTTVLLVLLTVVGLPLVRQDTTLQPAGDGGTTSGGHPQRVAASSALGDAPAWPAAGLLVHGDPASASPVRPDGAVPPWQQDGAAAALSPDGAVLAVDTGAARPGTRLPDGQPVVTFTSAAPETAPDEQARAVGGALSSRGRRLTTTGTPLWSSDSRRVALGLEPQGSSTAADPSALVVGRDGSVRLVGRPGTRPIGWDAQGRLVLAAVTAPYGARVPTHLVDPVTGRTSPGPAVTSPVGGDLSDLRLDPSGRHLAAVLVDRGAVRTGTAAWSSTPGALAVEITGEVREPADGYECVSWRGGQAYYFTPSRGELWQAGTGDVVTVVDPGLGATCLQLTSAALAGPQHASWLGTSTGWPAWHLHEVVGLAVLGLVVGLWAWASRWLPGGRSGGRAPGAPGAGASRRGSVVTRGRDDDPWDRVTQERYQGPFGR